MNSENVSLALFLTRGIPLAVWHNTGTIQRETSYYSELASRFHHLYFVTCGDKKEQSFIQPDKKISILYNRQNISSNLYSIISPFIHKKALSEANIIKTNQLDGAWTAIIAGWLLHQPVIVRAGYTWLDFFRQEISSGWKSFAVEFLEKWCLKQADSIFVTTQEIKDRYCEKYRIPTSKISVIPNFIDVSIFHPIPEIKAIKGRVCFVGRLQPIKNIDILIQAVSQIPDISLVIIGEGKQSNELKSLCSRLQVNAEFLGKIENEKLPQEILKSEIFVLPSSLEGHPKALIEAMACGGAVIGADVPGIRNLIQHQENGLLCPPTVEGIRDAINQFIKDDKLRQKCGINAAIFAANNFSLQKVINLEIQAILDCLSKSQTGDKLS